MIHSNTDWYSTSVTSCITLYMIEHTHTSEELNQRPFRLRKWVWAYSLDVLYLSYMSMGM